jgi:hypothetical protein
MDIDSGTRKSEDLGRLNICLGGADRSEWLLLTLESESRCVSGPRMRRFKAGLLWLASFNQEPADLGDLVSLLLNLPV